MRIRKASLLHVVLDVETTGLNAARGDRIIEIGAVVVQNGAIIDEFHSFVKPPKQISKSAQLVHGITDAMLIGQPTPEEVFPQFYDFIKNSVLVAHNAKFDIGFLRIEFPRHRLSLNHRYICTLEMSRQHFPRLSNHKLGTVYRHLVGKSTADIQAHRALGDAHMVAAIWLAMEGK
ncbi:MAG: 3'-5' exonuclease [Deltaproteobacteria bacterium]|nr:3'-5' exonuclease [Deltaproteobacteria bacterium]